MDPCHKTFEDEKTQKVSPTKIHNEYKMFLEHIHSLKPSLLKTQLSELLYPLYVYLFLYLLDENENSTHAKEFLRKYHFVALNKPQELEILKNSSTPKDVVSHLYFKNYGRGSFGVQYTESNYNHLQKWIEVNKKFLISKLLKENFHPEILNERLGKVDPVHPLPQKNFAAHEDLASGSECFSVKETDSSVFEDSSDEESSGCSSVEESDKLDIEDSSDKESVETVLSEESKSVDGSEYNHLIALENENSDDHEDLAVGSGCSSVKESDIEDSSEESDATFFSEVSKNVDGSEYNNLKAMDLENGNSDDDHEDLAVGSGCFSVEVSDKLDIEDTSDEESLGAVISEGSRSVDGTEYNHLKAIALDNGDTDADHEDLSVGSGCSSVEESDIECSSDEESVETVISEGSRCVDGSEYNHLKAIALENENSDDHKDLAVGSGCSSVEESDIEESSEEESLGTVISEGSNHVDGTEYNHLKAIALENGVETDLSEVSKSMDGNEYNHLKDLAFENGGETVLSKVSKNVDGSEYNLKDCSVMLEDVSGGKNWPKDKTFDAEELKTVFEELKGPSNTNGSKTPTVVVSKENERISDSGRCSPDVCKENGCETVVPEFQRKVYDTRLNSLKTIVSKTDIESIPVKSQMLKGSTEVVKNGIDSYEYLKASAIKNANCFVKVEDINIKNRLRNHKILSKKGPNAVSNGFAVTSDKKGKLFNGAKNPIVSKFEEEDLLRRSIASNNCFVILEDIYKSHILSNKNGILSNKKQKAVNGFKKLSLMNGFSTKPLKPKQYPLNSGATKPSISTEHPLKNQLTNGNGSVSEDSLESNLVNKLCFTPKDSSQFNCVNGLPSSCILQDVTDVASEDGLHSEDITDVASEDGLHSEDKIDVAPGDIQSEDNTDISPEYPVHGDDLHREGNTNVAPGDDLHSKDTTYIASSDDLHKEDNNDVALGDSLHSEDLTGVASGCMDSQSEDITGVASDDGFHNKDNIVVAPGNYLQCEDNTDAVHGDDLQREDLMEDAYSWVDLLTEDNIDVAPDDDLHSEDISDIASSDDSLSEEIEREETSSTDSSNEESAIISHKGLGDIGSRLKWNLDKIFCPSDCSDSNWSHWDSSDTDCSSADSNDSDSSSGDSNDSECSLVDRNDGASFCADAAFTLSKNKILLKDKALEMGFISKESIPISIEDFGEKPLEASSSCNQVESSLKTSQANTQNSDAVFTLSKNKLLWKKNEAEAKLCSDNCTPELSTVKSSSKTSNVANTQKSDAIFTLSKNKLLWKENEAEAKLCSDKCTPELSTVKAFSKTSNAANTQNSDAIFTLSKNKLLWKKNETEEKLCSDNCTSDLSTVKALSKTPNAANTRNSDAIFTLSNNKLLWKKNMPQTKLCSDKCTSELSNVKALARTPNSANTQNSDVCFTLEKGKILIENINPEVKVNSVPQQQTPTPPQSTSKSDETKSKRKYLWKDTREAKISCQRANAHKKIKENGIENISSPSSKAQKFKEELCEAGLPPELVKEILSLPYKQKKIVRSKLDKLLRKRKEKEGRNIFCAPCAITSKSSDIPLFKITDEASGIEAMSGFAKILIKGVWKGEDTFSKMVPLCEIISNEEYYPSTRESWLLETVIEKCKQSVVEPATNSNQVPPIRKLNIEYDEDLRCSAITQDLEYVACGFENSLYMWKSMDHIPRKYFVGLSAKNTGVCKQNAFVVRSKRIRGTTASPLQSLPWSVHCITCNPANNTFMVGSGNAIENWCPTTNLCLSSYKCHKGPVHHIALKPNCTEFVSSSEDERAIVWDIESSIPKCFYSHDKAVKFAAFHPKCPYLVTATSRVIRLWSEESCHPQGECRDHRADITHLAFSLSGDHLATSDKSGLVYIWDMKKRQRFASFSVSKEGVRRMCYNFSEDKSVLAVLGYDNYLRFYDESRLSSKRFPFYSTHFANTSTLNSIHFSKQNELIAITYTPKKPYQEFSRPLS